MLTVELHKRFWAPCKRHCEVRGGAGGGGSRGVHNGGGSGQLAPQLVAIPHPHGYQAQWVQLLTSLFFSVP